MVIPAISNRLRSLVDVDEEGYYRPSFMPNWVGSTARGLLNDLTESVPGLVGLASPVAQTISATVGGPTDRIAERVSRVVRDHLPGTSGVTGTVAAFLPQGVRDMVTGPANNVADKLGTTAQRVVQRWPSVYRPFAGQTGIAGGLANALFQKVVNPGTPEKIAMAAADAGNPFIEMQKDAWAAPALRLLTNAGRWLLRSKSLLKAQNAAAKLQGNAVRGLAKTHGVDAGVIENLWNQRFTTKGLANNDLAGIRGRVAETAKSLNRNLKQTHQPGLRAVETYQKTMAPSGPGMLGRAGEIAAWTAAPMAVGFGLDALRGGQEQPIVQPDLDESPLMPTTESAEMPMTKAPTTTYFDPDPYGLGGPIKAGAAGGLSDRFRETWQRLEPAIAKKIAEFGQWLRRPADVGGHAVDWGRVKRDLSVAGKRAVITVQPTARSTAEHFKHDAQKALPYAYSVEKGQLTPLGYAAAAVPVAGGGAWAYNELRGKTDQPEAAVGQQATEEPAATAKKANQTPPPTTTTTAAVPPVAPIQDGGLFGRIGQTWNNMSTADRAVAAMGLATVAGSLFNQFRPRKDGDEPSTLGNLAAALAGLGLTGYGAAGRDLGNVIPTATNVLVGQQKPVVAGLPATPKAVNSGAATSFAAAMRKYVKPDKTLDFVKLVRTPDEELKGLTSVLTPEQRSQGIALAKNFKPVWWQSAAARAAGYDVEQQRQRFLNLLGASEQ